RRPGEPIGGPLPTMNQAIRLNLGVKMAISLCPQRAAQFPPAHRLTQETLRELGGPVDFVLINRWHGGKDPSLARQLMKVVAPPNPRRRLGDERQWGGVLPALCPRSRQWLPVHVAAPQGQRPTELSVKVS